MESSQPERRARGIARKLALSGALAFLLSGQAHAAAMTVYKTATCGCCKAWVTHMRDAGFDVSVREVSQSELYERKRSLRVDPGLSSCHTALIDGYIVEGHVPAADVRRLLAERPEVAGIAVPGMPLGSPGMDYGGQRQPYSVIAFGDNGSMEVFAQHGM